MIAGGGGPARSLALTHASIARRGDTQGRETFHEGLVVGGTGEWYRWPCVSERRVD